MEIESLDSPITVTGRKRPGTFLSSAFDLPALIEIIKHSKAWENGEIDTLVLLKNPDEKVILAAVHEGTQITSFQENDSVTFQILEGKLRYSSHNDSVILKKGQIMIIDEKIKYKLIAGEETVFLLTILNTSLKIA
jgi:quercetin dioxygenase-like cupin family protein